MYQSVNFSNFVDAFRQSDRKDNFSYEGLEALFNYLELREADMDRPMKLDVIALCCEYQEIEDDEDSYRYYIGDDADREDLIIAILGSSVLVREG